MLEPSLALFGPVQKSRRSPATELKPVPAESWARFPTIEFS